MWEIISCQIHLAANNLTNLLIISLIKDIAYFEARSWYRFNANIVCTIPAPNIIGLPFL